MMNLESYGLDHQVKEFKNNRAGFRIQDQKKSDVIKSI